MTARWRKCWFNFIVSFLFFYDFVFLSQVMRNKYNIFLLWLVYANSFLSFDLILMTKRALSRDNTWNLCVIKRVTNLTRTYTKYLRPTSWPHHWYMSPGLFMIFFYLDYIHTSNTIQKHIIQLIEKIDRELVPNCGILAYWPSALTPSQNSRLLL